MKYVKLLLAIVIVFVVFSCKNNDVSTVEETIDISKVKITVKRGAFHDDRFVLEDSIIRFIPAANGMLEEFPQYTVASETVLKSSEVTSFLKAIEDKGFFELETNYSSETTDNSMLSITVEYRDREKSVYSEDFERNCPEVLQFIENEIVRLHGKNLKRQLLPG